MNYVILSACTHSQFPPPHFERALHLVNPGLHHSRAKMDVLCLLINSCAGLETQQINVVGSSKFKWLGQIKLPSKIRIKEA